MRKNIVFTTILMILSCTIGAFGQVHGPTPPPPSITPIFTGSSSLTVCEGSGATSINGNLTITDASATGTTETYSVTSAPTHGTLSGFTATTTTSGGGATPTGCTYTPTTGYSGSDAFTIQVNNGSATATTTISVSVTGSPTVTAVSPLSGIPGTAVTITGLNFNTTASNDRVWFGSVEGTVTSASGTSLTVTIPNGGVYAPITVETSDCGLMSGFGGMPFLPSFDNTGDITGTVNFDPRVNFTVGSSANHIAYGDIDGDGKTDIIVNNSGSGTVSVYLNTSTAGSVSFASAVTVITGASFPGQPGVRDIDGDGKPELVFMSASSPAAVHVYLNTSTPGSISFGTPLVITYVTNANSVTLSDIDGDGKVDIIGNTLTTMSVFRNISTIGSLSFASRLNYSAPGNINSIAAGDIDGDQKPDVLISTSNGTSSLSVFRNTSTPGSISLATRQDFATTSGSGNYVAVADIDGDGKQDVLTINQGAGSFSLFPNTSTSGSISLGAGWIIR